MNSLDTSSDLVSPAAEFLSEGDRGSILSVGSSDLDDLIEFLSFLFKSRGEVFKSRDKSLVSFDNSSDVHSSWECIVGRLRHVDVVVGMNDGLLGEIKDRRVPCHLFDRQDIQWLYWQ